MDVFSKLGALTIFHTDPSRKFHCFSYLKLSSQFMENGVCLLKKLHLGDLLVEVSSANQYQLLANSSAISSFLVSVQFHPTLNTIRGVISKPEILYSKKDDIRETERSRRC